MVIFDSRDGTDGDMGAWVDARLIAMDGQSGRIHWMRDQMYWKGTPAIADVNGDGYAEIVVASTELSVLLLYVVQLGRMFGKRMYI